MLPGRFCILFCALIAFAFSAHGRACASSADCEGLPCIHTLSEGFKCMVMLNMGSERPMVSFTSGPMCTNDADCVKSRCLVNRCIGNVTLVTNYEFYAAAFIELRTVMEKYPGNRTRVARLADEYRIFMGQRGQLPFAKELLFSAIQSSVDALESMFPFLGDILERQ